ncbi:hypothetical protein AJ79_02890 [Helicocarpus griseus UAMH5409]|uniref:Uncharacterized protein n=1 Tax=Helicocarpus griseus UAMH5409 TaxID=1447875 RepID=A0A2B7XSH5_9EURO|nr:hypothetical protein AJ79_02890 [Helicocarpus griseus UAMH5409]
MEEPNTQTPASGKKRGYMTKNDEPSSIPGACKFSPHPKGAREASRWKSLSESADIDVPIEPTILVPDPSPAKTLQDSDGDTPKSETLGGSLARRRRHGEYHHRPPVWSIRPLDEDNNGFSDVIVDFDPDGLECPTGLETGISSSHSHSQPTTESQKKPTYTLQSQMNLDPAIFDPLVNLPGNILFQSQLDAMASTWSREPLIVAMAGTDNEKGGGPDDRSRTRDSTAAEPKPNELPQPDDKNPSPLPTASSAPAIDPYHCYDAGKSSSSAPQNRGPCASGSHGSSLLDEIDETPFIYEYDKFPPSALDFDPDLTPVEERPSDENSPAIGLDQTRTCDTFRTAFTTAQTSQGANSPPCQQEEEDNEGDHNQTKRVDFAFPTQQAQQDQDMNRQPNQQEVDQEPSSGIDLPQSQINVQAPVGGSPLSGDSSAGPSASGESRLIHRQQSTDHRLLACYRDIRVVMNAHTGYPIGPNRHFGYAIETGSRVVCVCDTVIEETYDDVFPMRLGDAYIVLKMYGDLWTSCLKLTLPNQTWAAYPRAKPNLLKDKNVFVRPESNIRFLPLCALTLDANFGDYLARHPRATGGYGLLPATGQKVVPPKRTFSSPENHAGFSVRVPKEVLRQAKYPNMPQDQHAIALPPDKDDLSFGHVPENTPPGMTGIDPDETYTGLIDSIPKFASKLENRINEGKGSLRSVKEKIHGSSKTLRKSISGHFRAISEQSLRQRFRSNQGVSHEGSISRQSEGISQEPTIVTPRALGQSRKAEGISREIGTDTGHASGKACEPEENAPVDEVDTAHNSGTTQDVESEVPPAMEDTTHYAEDARNTADDHEEGRTTEGSSRHAGPPAEPTVPNILRGRCATTTVTEVKCGEE